MMKRAAILAVFLIASIYAAAQDQRYAAAQDLRPPHGGEGGRHEGGMASVPSASDMAAYNDARIAGMKAGLNLKQDQEAAWGTFEKGYRARLEEEQDGERRMRSMRNGSADGGAESLLDNLKRMAASYDQAAKSAKRFSDSLQPLFDVLTPDQRNRINLLYMYSENGPGMPLHDRPGHDGKMTDQNSPRSPQ